LLYELSGKVIMKLQRLLAILSLLCERDKATAQELAGRFEVSKRRVIQKTQKTINTDTLLSSFVAYT